MLKVGRVLFLPERVAVDPTASPEAPDGATFEAAVGLGLHELEEGIIDQRQGAEGERRSATRVMDRPFSWAAREAHCCSGSAAG